MDDVDNKQQTTALFLSTIVTRTRRHTELKKNWQTWWETCAVPENIQFSFHAVFYTVKLHSLRHCWRVTQIWVFNTVNLGTSASSP
jgi:hypothetical protein